MKKYIFWVIVLGVLLNTVLLAQGSTVFPVFGIGFGSQILYSVEEAGDSTMQSGTGIRDASLLFRTKINPHIQGDMTYSLNKSSLLDAYVLISVNEFFNVRMGRFMGASPRSAGGTSKFSTDFIHFPLMARKYAEATGTVDYRHIGIQVEGRWKWYEYKLFSHNQNNSENFSPSINLNISSGNESVAWNNWDMEHRVYLDIFNAECGIHVGKYLASNGASLIKASSYFYYNEKLAKKLVFKAENIFLETSPGVNALGTHLYFGYKMNQGNLAQVSLQTWDASMDTDNNEENNVQLGWVHSFTPEQFHDQKLILAYVIKSEAGSELKNNLFYMAYQFSIKGRI